MALKGFFMTQFSGRCSVEVVASERRRDELGADVALASRFLSIRDILPSVVTGGSNRQQTGRRPGQYWQKCALGMPGDFVGRLEGRELSRRLGGIPNHYKPGVAL